MGAALLRTPDKLCAILEALVREVAPEFEIGISVKIRLLETPAETEALVRRLVATRHYGPDRPLPDDADAPPGAGHPGPTAHGSRRVAARQAWPA